MPATFTVAETGLLPGVPGEPAPLRDQSPPVAGKDFDPVTTGSFAVSVTIGNRSNYFSQQFSLGELRDGLDGWSQEFETTTQILHGWK